MRKVDTPADNLEAAATLIIDGSVRKRGAGAGGEGSCALETVLSRKPSGPNPPPHTRPTHTPHHPCSPDITVIMEIHSDL